MDAADARLITDLAERMRAAGPASKDPDAERLIFEQIGRQPDSLYVLVQAVLLQEQALRTSQDRIAALEQELAQRAEPEPRRGFLDSLFGGGEPGHAAQSRPAPAAAQAQADRASAPGQPGPVLGTPAAAPSGGGSFLRTAAAGALGVAGGALLASSISNMFSGSDAQAQEQQTADAEQAGYERGAEDQAAQDQGGWDQGGWDQGGWDDGGGWDV